MKHREPSISVKLAYDPLVDGMLEYIKHRTAANGIKSYFDFGPVYSGQIPYTYDPRLKEITENDELMKFITRGLDACHTRITVVKASVLKAHQRHPSYNLRDSSWPTAN